ncbi:methyl-accepting chemotaxis protein [Anaerovorax odorimutans]|uniref:methyl-accepting chemotaxis protein n=1 Tax=Anaerovorax odorimutans TaxID=109327 RepID=UPI0003F8E851|nr:methyl-accepting chemotaxis protein [Anaerovorax odorimutans]
MKLLKNMKLATKTAILISSLLIIIFIILIGFSITYTGKNMEKSISGEFNSMSKSNGLQVQQTIDTTESATLDISTYLEKQYNLLEEMQASGQELGESASSVYNIPINSVNYDTEKYITATARNIAVNNPGINGMGVMFEPYKFDKNIESYAFFISKTDSDGVVKPFDVYSQYSKEDYYKMAVEEKDMIFTDPFEYDGQMIISVATPIIHNNEVKGIIVADFNLENFSKLDSTNEEYPSMYAKLFNDRGMIIYDSNDFGNVGKNMSSVYADKGELDQVTSSFEKGEKFARETTVADGKKVTCFYNPIEAGNSNWWTLTAVDSKDMNKAATKTTIWLIIISILALIVIVIATLIILKKMLNPIQTVVMAAKEISNGNFDIHLNSDSKDEIGVLTNTFDNTVRILKTIIQDISHVLNNIANKNLDVETSAHYVGDLAEIEKSMKNIIGNLNNVMGDINTSSDQVSIGSEQVSAGAQALSQGATEQASSLEELSATITEISEQVQQNAENAKNAAEATAQSGNKINESNKQMDEMIVAISEISNKSNEIGRIIRTIDDIAFQTNILALNAAVEAARAGTAGKGFAVVAEEVRNLASKSAEAARNTTVLIEETVTAVENGTKIASETAQSMLTVVDGAEKVIVLINEIANASSSQAVAISQVTQGVDQISAVVQTNSATAEESAAASEELSGQALMLKQMVGEFKFKNSNSIINNKQDSELNLDVINEELSDSKY